MIETIFGERDPDCLEGEGCSPQASLSNAALTLPLPLPLPLTLTLSLTLTLTLTTRRPAPRSPPPPSASACDGCATGLRQTSHLRRG